MANKAVLPDSYTNRDASANGQPDADRGAYQDPYGNDHTRGNGRGDGNSAANANGAQV